MNERRIANFADIMEPCFISRDTDVWRLPISRNKEVNSLRRVGQVERRFNCYEKKELT